MKSTLFTLSIVVFIISLLVGGYFLWRIKPLGLGTFPAVISNLPMTEGPKYLAKEKVYTAFYGTPADGVLYSVKEMPSADEAAGEVRRQRESLVANRDEGAYLQPFVPAQADDEKNGVLAYRQGELSNALWAEGSRINFVFGSDEYAVERVTDALRGHSQEPFTLYSLLKNLPGQIKHWLGVIVPAIVGALALLVMLTTFLGGRRKTGANI